MSSKSPTSEFYFSAASVRSTKNTAPLGSVKTVH